MPQIFHVHTFDAVAKDTIGLNTLLKIHHSIRAHRNKLTEEKQ